MKDGYVQLESSRIILTGASAGLGAECARHFSRLGATVVLVARRRSKLLKLAKEINSRGGYAIPLAADLVEVEEIKRIRKVVTDELGGVDILINNAGVYLEGVELIKTDIGDWDRIINTNLRAPYLLCSAFMPNMIERGYGRVVNIISATGHLAGVGAFRVSKVALEVLTAVLATEVEETGVAVAAFNPGWMQTETSYSGRAPSGAARALIDLVCRNESFINGATIDLLWKGRQYLLRRRKTNSGPFGLPPR